MQTEIKWVDLEGLYTERLKGQKVFVPCSFEQYDQMLNGVMPKAMSNDRFLGGEAYAWTEQGDLYAACKQVVGECFITLATIAEYLSNFSAFTNK